MVFDEKTAPIVRKIFQWKIEGLSLPAIADRLDLFKQGLIIVQIFIGSLFFITSIGLFRQLHFILSKDKGEDMMRGQKWRAFLLDLSFLGWRVLTILTFGVLGIFFTGAFIEAVNAELYAVLKEERMRRLDADRTILADTAQELD